MTFDGKITTTFVMFALFTGACLMSVGLAGKAAFMPLMVGVPGALLTGAQLIIDIRSARARKEEPNVVAAKDKRAEGAHTETEMFIWLGAFTSILLGLGFILGGPLAVLLFVRFGSKDSWRDALFASVGTLAVLYGIFTLLLGLSLFPGFLPEFLLSL